MPPDHATRSVPGWAAQRVSNDPVDASRGHKTHRHVHSFGWRHQRAPNDSLAGQPRHCVTVASIERGRDRTRRRCRGWNPGHPRDRREYSPLYYNDILVSRDLGVPLIRR